MSHKVKILRAPSREIITGEPHEGEGKGKGKDEGKGKGKNCCGNSNLDFHPKFLPPKIVFFILYIL